MNSMITVNQTAVVADYKTLDFNLFDRFIAYVDRSDKTMQTYITNLRQFAAWLSYAAIDRPERADVISYRQYLLSDHHAIRLDRDSITGWSYRTDASGHRVTVKCKPNTVQQYLRSVCQFFRWTASEGLYPNIADNIHAPKVSTNTHRKEALTAEDVLTIENSIIRQADRKSELSQTAAKDATGRTERATEQGKRLYAMYLLSVTAGLRTIELERLNVEDVQCRAGNAYIYITGKGHTEADQKKPIAPEVYEAIRDYLNSRTDRPTANSPLFVSTGNRSGGKRILARTISGMLKQAMKGAGYDSERLTAHSLRHTAGTAVMTLSGDLYTTQKYMRHCNPATTEIYLHVDTEKKESQIAKQVFDYYHGQQSSNSRNRLETLLNSFSPDQIDRLTAMAASIA